MGAEDRKKAGELALGLNKIMERLCPEIRAKAFEALAPFWFDVEAPQVEGQPLKPVIKRLAKGGGKEVSTVEDAAEFFGRFEDQKPADNVKLIVAWLYSQYGVYPITGAEITRNANASGLTVAPRSDMTMRQAQHAGKSLFSKQAKGWALTLAGEKYMKETYQVKRGNKPQPEQENE